jgi:hypothetical protein
LRAAAGGDALAAKCERPLILDAADGLPVLPEASAPDPIFLLPWFDQRDKEVAHAVKVLLVPGGTPRSVLPGKITTEKRLPRMLSELGKNESLLQKRLWEEFGKLPHESKKQTLDAYEAVGEFLKSLGEVGQELDQAPER